MNNANDSLKVKFHSWNSRCSYGVFYVTVINIVHSCFCLQKQQTCFSLLFCFQFCTFIFPDCTSNPECIFSIVAKICDTECKSETCLTYPSLDEDIPFLDEGFKLAVEDYRKKFDNRTTPEENLTLPQQAQLLKGSYEEQLIPRSHQHLRWLDTVFQGQYLTSLSINYVAINKVLGKLPPQLY